MDWPELRAVVDRSITASSLAEPVVYTRQGGGMIYLAARAVFDLEGYEVDLQTGVRVATGYPKLGILNAEIGNAPAAQGDTVSVAGVSYIVQRVLPGERGWSHCDLHNA